MMKSYCMTKADAKIGFAGIEYAFEFKFSKYEKRSGWFQSPTHHFVDKPHQIAATINFTNGHLFSGVLDHEAIAKGHTFFDTQPVNNEHVSWRNSYSIFDLGNFEIVDSFQWSGHKPIEIFDDRPNATHRRPVYTEPPRWEIAAVDHRKGERLLMLIGHNTKDHMFRINTRLNMIMNQARMVLEPWEEQLRENAKWGFKEGQDMPEDKRAGWNEVLGEMLDRNEPDRPDFHEGF